MNEKIPGPTGGLNRTGEWFVPSAGPLKFRVLVGLLFLPYTGMVLSYTVIGSMLAPTIAWDRVAAIVVIYFFGLGVGAHALDALGSKRVKPWGAVFSRRVLWVFATTSIVSAYAIGIYYMIFYTPLLWGVALLEGFFLFAYNLEWFHGRFHTDGWFAFSWGTLPVLAGYVLQTNRMTVPVLIIGASMGLLSLVEIKSSRPYKELKRGIQPQGFRRMDGEVQCFESILKGISFGVILLGMGMLTWRWVY